MLKIVARVPDADLSCVAQKVEVVQNLNKFTTMARVYNFVIETRWFSDFGRARNSEHEIGIPTFATYYCRNYFFMVRP